MFVAVTARRIVRPTSSSVSTWLVPVAAAIAVHAPPPASQRFHCLA